MKNSRNPVKDELLWEMFKVLISRGYSVTEATNAAPRIFNEMREKIEAGYK